MKLSFCINGRYFQIYPRSSMWHFNAFFFSNFWMTWVLLVGPLIPLFWTSGNVCPGFQSQDGSLACFLTWVILRFTSGVTLADCIEIHMAAKSFRSTYLQTCPQALVEVWGSNILWKCFQWTEIRNFCFQSPLGHTAFDFNSPTPPVMVDKTVILGDGHWL